MHRLEGVYTALITPTVGRAEIDWATFDRLLELQAAASVQGVVVGGTTAESPTLSNEEVRRLSGRARERLPGTVEVVAATGRNHLDGTLELTGFAADAGISTVMLVDPYYNAPSSIEIRREYIEPVAERFPDLGILPYVIPGRTGTRLDPREIAGMLSDRRRIAGVKDATGDEAYAKELRRRCPTLPILSGDDGRTLAMMDDAAVRADGVVSVVANIVPGAVVDMVRAARAGDWTNARRLGAALLPLFDTVTIRVVERAADGTEVPVRSRNPVPIKTAMALLGVPVGACRPPLGRLTQKGLSTLQEALAATHRQAPEALRPIVEAFGGNATERLADRSRGPELSYVAV
jgi:4-hydroxy-tetrahydrodipicolinate synthase